MRGPAAHHLKPYDRPDVEVLVDGHWCPGEVRMQIQHDDGTWVLEVAYRPHGKLSSMIDSFPADRVRDDMIDRSHGRRP